MKTKVILFDLDGTLLPMDQDRFVKAYFGGIAKRLAPYGYEPNALINGIWKGTGAMIKNDGAKSNEEVFWDVFASMFGDKARADEPKFEQFYIEDFDKVQLSCGFDPKAAPTIAALKAKGYRLALATNPIFPSIATEKRMKWAGLDKSDFELFTTYENSRYCKPNLEYYKEILSRLGVSAEECLMVGNDVSEDMVVEKLGMKVFLMPACLLNRENKDLSVYPQGDFDDLLAFVDGLE
ncbi:MAG: HAD family hydrolase [Clostridia bacterium]|nr:HAD family hydrolase [Clostridia bacterium]